MLGLHVTPAMSSDCIFPALPLNSKPKHGQSCAYIYTHHSSPTSVQKHSCKSVCFFLCFYLLISYLLTESCKDILSATGNYAQPEVTTLTWWWFTMKRRKGNEFHCGFFFFPPWTHCRPILVFQDYYAFVSTYFQNPV